MDERLATVSEVEGQVQDLTKVWAVLAICHKANSSSLKRTVRKGPQGDEYDGYDK